MIHRLITLLLGFTLLQFAICNDCIGKPDGEHIHRACNYYVECRNQQEFPVFCTKPYVYNHVKRKCDLESVSPPPCGNQVNCNGIPDGRYPLVNLDCKCYFTYLRWDVYLELCNWAHLVPPPCGTLPPVVTPEPVTQTPIVEQTTTTKPPVLETTQRPVLGNCTANNICDVNGEVCCWHIQPNISGCCAQGEMCCPSAIGDFHDCCPISDGVCHAVGGTGCYKNRVRDNQPKIRGRS
ncbi:DgyrCDS1911 [Dimorphilus gyrociliatus]|uniref:DgyrCDS1911 n=1 Tax=Dimorphilus gyrociliatus TaxID=2664684 RepID=A0A7I8VA26_9ANNE|nr:DgyrCDS1911 [Dimorphilus gyrociliatus]